MNYAFALVIMIVFGGLVGYLFGSILFAVHIGKLFKKQDVRNTGSNNPGFTNSTRAYGKKIGLIVLLLDVLKTILPIMIFYCIYRFTLESYCIPFITNSYNPRIFIYVPGIFAIVGHIFPIFHKFKGGKGVASYGGFCICLSPFIALTGIIIIVTCLLITKKMAIGSITAAFFIPFLILIPGINYLYLMYPNIVTCTNIGINQLVIFIPIFVCCFLLSCLVIYRHKNNILNIINSNKN